MAVSLAGKTALVTGEVPAITPTVSFACMQPVVCELSHLSLHAMYAGSSQGIGLGMLRALASAGADVVMHGLVSTDELKQKTDALHKEFGVKVGFSTANVRKPQEIRHVTLCYPCYSRHIGIATMR